MIRILLCLLIVQSTLSTLSSPKPIQPIIKKLLSEKRSVRIYSLIETQWGNFKDLPYNFNNSAHFLLKTPSGLFLNIEGTGRLYRINQKGNSIDFERIDSTYFSGYNFRSLLFNIGDSMYSFGGEGFWHTNGDLRLFDNSITHEWHALKLNKIIHGIFRPIDHLYQFQFLDTLNRTLIISGNPYNQNHSLKSTGLDSNSEKMLFKLDLKNSNWSELGIKNFQSNQELVQTPFGILNGGFLVDIINNKKYFTNLHLERSKMFGKSTLENLISITFCIDSTIYFGNNNGLFDSLSISRSNLIDTGEPAYFPKETDSSFSKDNLILFSLFFMAALSLLLIIVNIKQRNRYKSNTKPTFSIKVEELEPTPIQITQDKTEINTLYRSGKLVELMNEQEINFLRYLFEHSADERMTTIEEINTKLGTFKKTIEIQKKMRSDMINGINSKLSTFSKSTKPVIDKQRSEFDKRSFEYYINKEHMGLVDNIIKGSRS